MQDITSPIERLIALAMAEEPITLCAECYGPCHVTGACQCDNDTFCLVCQHYASHYNEFLLKEAVGSMLWNNADLAEQVKLKDLGFADQVISHAIRAGAHANIEPRHLAALWEACEKLMEESDVQR